jgi:hypothetical protein
VLNWDCRKILGHYFSRLILILPLIRFPEFQLRLNLLRIRLYKFQNQKKKGHQPMKAKSLIAIVFCVTILSTGATHAADDKVEVSPGSDTEIKALENDQLGPDAVIVRISQLPARGTAEIKEGNRVIVYHAPAQFVDTDTLRYVAKPSADAGADKEHKFSVTIASTGQNPASQISETQYSQAFKVLVLLLVLSIALETGLATLFNWRWFIIIAEARGLKIPVSVAVASIFVYTYDLDAIAKILTAFGDAQRYPDSLVGKFITALILAGGSGAVNTLFQSLGIRTPFRQQEIAKQRKSQSRLKISVTRDKVATNEPITVSIDGALIGSIDAGKNQGGWPLGWPIEPGERKIEISGVDAAGKTVSTPATKTFAPVSL